MHIVERKGTNNFTPFAISFSRLSNEHFGVYLWMEFFPKTDFGRKIGDFLFKPELECHYKRYGRRGKKEAALTELFETPFSRKMLSLNWYQMSWKSIARCTLELFRSPNGDYLDGKKIQYIFGLRVFPLFFHIVKTFLWRGIRYCIWVGFALWRPRPQNWQ